MYSPCGDTEGVQLLSDWIMWAFLFDDRYCDDGPIARDPTAFNHLALNLMNFGLYPEHAPLGIADFDAFAASMSDIVTRVRARTNEAQAAMIALSQLRWAPAAACDVSDRSGGDMRSVDEHMIARRPDGADITTIHLIEISENTWLDHAA
ncbi:terpene synthase family protein, partial [Nocardia gipuzkoensis]